MRERLLLVGIIIIAFLLRFWNLSTIPVSLSHDEVAIGYNAWSILQTGKDEYGKSFPVLFKSFDDYKLPGYIYSTAISEKLFGLTPLGVRLPSVLLGVATVLVLFLLLKELKIDDRGNISILGAFLLAISPWHINFSRAAFEANGSLFFIVLSIFFLFRSIRSNRYLLLVSFSSVAALYFYYTARILLPIVFLTAFILYRKELLKEKKYLLLALVFAFILLFPLMQNMFGVGSSRLNQVSIFNDKSLTNPYSEAIVRNSNSLISKAVYNRRVAFAQEFFDNYLKNFAPDFYFTNGTGPMGLIYLWEIPFFFSGVYFLLKIKKPWKWIILSWFAAVPVVGGLSLGQPNALRTLANAPVASILTAFGLANAFLLFRQSKYIRLFLTIFLLIVASFFVRFIFLYFDYYNNLNASSWGDGTKQMVSYISEHKNEYKTVYVTGDNWRPYIYYLFYGMYSPANYQKTGTIQTIDNINFGQADWDSGNGIRLKDTDLSTLSNKETIFILSEKDFLYQENYVQKKYNYKILVLNKINGEIVKNAYYAVVIE